jgi:hypothetical protein
MCMCVYVEGFEKILHVLSRTDKTLAKNNRGGSLISTDKTECLPVHHISPAF